MERPVGAISLTNTELMLPPPEQQVEKAYATVSLDYSWDFSLNEIV